MSTSRSPLPIQRKRNLENAYLNRFELEGQKIYSRTSNKSSLLTRSPASLQIFQIPLGICKNSGNRKLPSLKIEENKKSLLIEKDNEIINLTEKESRDNSSSSYVKVSKDFAHEFNILKSKTIIYEDQLSKERTLRTDLEHTISNLQDKLENANQEIRKLKAVNDRMDPVIIFDEILSIERFNTIELAKQPYVTKKTRRGSLFPDIDATDYKELHEQGELKIKVLEEKLELYKGIIQTLKLSTPKELSEQHEIMNDIKKQNINFQEKLLKQADALYEKTLEYFLFRLKNTSNAKEKIVRQLYNLEDKLEEIPQLKEHIQHLLGLIQQLRKDIKNAAFRHRALNKGSEENNGMKVLLDFISISKHAKEGLARIFKKLSENKSQQ